MMLWSMALIWPALYALLGSQPESSRPLWHRALGATLLLLVVLQSASQIGLEQGVFYALFAASGLVCLYLLVRAWHPRSCRLIAALSLLLCLLGGISESAF